MGHHDNEYALIAISPLSVDYVDGQSILYRL